VLYKIARFGFAAGTALYLAACGSESHDHHNHGHHDHGTHDHGHAEDSHEGHDHAHPLPDLLSASDAGIVDVPAPPPRVSLVDMFAWSIVDEAQDPWSTSGSSEERCDEDAVKGETTPDGDWFDVNTSFCDYVTVVQPLVVDIAADTDLHINIYHFVLEAAEGPFNFAVALGDPAEVVWETTYDPQGDTGTIDETWKAARDYSKGENIYFHLSNHGSNNWSLTDLSKSLPE